MPVQATSLATDLLRLEKQRTETLGHSTPGHRTLLCFTHVGIVTFGNVSPRLSLGPSWRGGAGRAGPPRVRNGPGAGLGRGPAPPSPPSPKRSATGPTTSTPSGVAAGRPPEGGAAVGPPRVGSCLELLSIFGGWSSRDPEGAPDSCADTRSHPVAASKPRAELSSKLAPFSFGQHLGALA